MSRTSGAGRGQGYSVPAEAVNNANSRLLRYLQDPGMMSIRYSDDTSQQICCRAYASLVLARQQKRRSVRCVKSGSATLRLLPGFR